MVNKKENISKALPTSDMNEVKWLYNPVVYSQLVGDFSLLQQRILLGIIDKLQPNIQRCIDCFRETGTWSALFNPDDMTADALTTVINASDIGVTPDLYPKLCVAVQDLFDMTIKCYEYDKVKKIKTYTKIHLFDSLKMVEHCNPSDNKRRTGEIEISMSLKGMLACTNMADGYISQVARVARECKLKRTVTMYQLLCRYRDVGCKIIPYDEICVQLALTDEFYLKEKTSKVQSDNGEIVTISKVAKTNPYNKFNKVKSRVLDPCCKEMEELAEKGAIDFSFTYEPIYKTDNKRRNPDGIKFTIHKGPLGEYHEVRTKRVSQERKLIGWLIRECPDLKKSELTALISSVDDARWDFFKQFAYTTIDTAKNAQADDVASYVIALLNDWQGDTIVSIDKTEGKTVKKKSLRQKQWENFIAAYSGRAKSLLAECRFKSFTVARCTVNIECSHEVRENLSLLELTIQENHDFYNSLAYAFGVPTARLSVSESEE